MAGIEDLNKIALTPFMCYVLAFLFFLLAVGAYKLGMADVALACVTAAGGLIVYAQSLKQAETRAVKAIAEVNQAKMVASQEMLAESQAKLDENNIVLNALVDQIAQKSSCERPPGATDAKITKGKCEFEQPLAPLATVIKELGKS